MKNKNRKMNIYLPETLYEQLRTQSFKERKSISQIIREAVKVVKLKK